MNYMTMFFPISDPKLLQYLRLNIRVINASIISTSFVDKVFLFGLVDSLSDFMVQ